MLAVNYPRAESDLDPENVTQQIVLLLAVERARAIAAHCCGVQRSLLPSGIVSGICILNRF